MRSSPRRRRLLNRTGLAFLSVVALVGGSTPAWGHGTIAGGGGDRIHMCIRSLSPRIVRLVTPGEVCSSFEQGIDLPHEGTLIGVAVGPPVTTGPGGLVVGPNVLSPPIVASCPPDVVTPPNTLTYRAVGATFTHTADLALAVSLPISPTTWQVEFIAATGGPKVITVSAVCVAQFVQS